MAEVQSTTRPNPRKRAASKAPTKAAKAAPAVTKAETETEETTIDRFKFEMNILDETKTYTKCAPPPDSGCVGNLYVPKGATQVLVLVIGPKS